jgi:hypothetical protein
MRCSARTAGGALRDAASRATATLQGATDQLPPPWAASPRAAELRLAPHDAPCRFISPAVFQAYLQAIAALPAGAQGVALGGERERAALLSEEQNCALAAALLSAAPARAGALRRLQLRHPLQHLGAVKALTSGLTSVTSLLLRLHNPCRSGPRLQLPPQLQALDLRPSNVTGLAISPAAAGSPSSALTRLLTNDIDIQGLQYLPQLQELVVESWATEDDGVRAPIEAPVQDLVRLTRLTCLELRSEICWSDWALAAGAAAPAACAAPGSKTLELDPGAGAAGAACVARQLAELAVLCRLSTRRPQQAGVGGAGGGARGCLARLMPPLERASIGGLPLAGCGECAVMQHRADKSSCSCRGTAALGRCHSSALSDTR